MEEFGLLSVLLMVSFLNATGDQIVTSIRGDRGEILHADEVAAIEAEAAEEVEAIVIDLEVSIGATEERLALCKRSVAEDQQDHYPGNVQEEVRRNPELGPTDWVLEVCQAYLSGRIDARVEAREELRQLLESSP